MRNILIFSILASTILFFISCEKSSLEIDYINHGTSFGECIGYCYEEITIAPNQVNYLKRGWDTEGVLPEYTDSIPFSISEWNILVEKIDLSLFLTTDEVIGCPDCLDGGAEWIEISTNGSIHRVTFDAFLNHEFCELYINDLRQHLDSF